LAGVGPGSRSGSHLRDADAVAQRSSLMFSLISKWSAFVKLSHTIFALPFALASMALAARENRGWPGWRVFLLVLGAMFCARTCAMAFNRIVDRKFDALNPRTSERHLPVGEISLPSAIALCSLSAAGLIACAWFLNPVCFYLSPVALFFICFYSLTKRFTDYTHVFLGIALALAPIGAWLAVKGTDLVLLPWKESFLLPVLMAIGVVFWLIGFDIIYAMQDHEFDRKHGLRSLVVAWGPANALRAAFLSHLVMWFVLLAFGIAARFRGVAFFVGMLVILVCLLMEHFIARRRSVGWINIAFFRLNAVISAVFFVVTLAEVVFFDFFRLKR
jgi:4-hydroxybenzoate polyprenyltransferase